MCVYLCSHITSAIPLPNKAWRSEVCTLRSRFLPTVNKPTIPNTHIIIPWLSVPFRGRNKLGYSNQLYFSTSTLLISFFTTSQLPSAWMNEWMTGGGGGSCKKGVGNNTVYVYIKKNTSPSPAITDRPELLMRVRVRAADRQAGRGEGLRAILVGWLGGDVGVAEWLSYRLHQIIISISLVGFLSQLTQFFFSLNIIILNRLPLVFTNYLSRCNFKIRFISSLSKYICWKVW